MFLKNCKHIISLNKLLIKNRNRDTIDITFKVLKAFLSGKEAKGFFAYEVDCSFNPKILEHCFLERLIGEAQSFIKMRKYSDLKFSYFD